MAVSYPKPVSEMSREELIREIEKYAASTAADIRRWQGSRAALGRVRAMIEAYKALSKHD